MSGPLPASHILTRRGFVATAAAASLATKTAHAASEPWTREKFEHAMAASGRPCSLSQPQFDATQARKPAALKRIQQYLKDRLGAADPAVMAAFEQVPRDYFHYVYSDRHAEPGVAYEDNPKPWAIGYGSALSDYLGQAYMTQICKPRPGEISLEIGTGSGFQSSLLSRIVDQAYSIEIIEPLGRAVGKIFAPLGYTNVHSRVGDGYYGWPEVEGGFDIIMATCAAQYAPPDLFRAAETERPHDYPHRPALQARPSAVRLYQDARGKVHTRRDVGVFFIPMTGAMMKIPAPIVPVAASQPAASQPVVAAPAPPSAAPPAVAPVRPPAPPPMLPVPTPLAPPLQVQPPPRPKEIAF